MKKILNNLELYIAGICLIVMLLIDFANVLGRFVFGTAWAFTEELVCGLFALITLFGAAGSARMGNGIGLSVLTDLLPADKQKYVRTIQAIAIIVFSALLLKYGIVMVRNEIRFNIKTAALGWPEAIFGVFIPIGAVFLIIRSAQYMIEGFVKKEKV